ncbi:hypothetical protein Slin15195_G041090 [Septoria linicola]|uniref:Uncharacterized protein n=1 Tax=Septoria linicola TaxID=215465 RepID=A0A9Q9EHA0_9PEZI|nr:hypothetical protein Slin14017_G044620 [Septoria linicola]USW50790.1 hypothetical protein Slin15195_G041090 [Septoria linicola]
MDNYAPPDVEPESLYDESLIVDLISRLYNMLIELGALEESLVVWPSTGGHALDLSHLTEETSMDSRVVSLLRRLPIVRNYVVVAPGMATFDYSNPSYLKLSRYIDRFSTTPTSERIEPSPAPGTALLLFEGHDDAYPRLVLDVDDNTIRYFDGELETQISRDLDNGRWSASVNSYVNYPAEYAPLYLQRMIDKLLEASWIPCGFAVFSLSDYHFEPGVIELQRELVEDYDWPHTFYRDAWTNDSSGYFDRVMGI